MELFPPIFKEIPFQRPDHVYEHVRAKNTLLLESVKGPERIARYSFICLEPYLVFKVRKGVVEIECGGRKSLSTRHPIERLRELLTGYGQQPVEDLPPFQGGAVGMFSYDFVRYLEKTPDGCKDDLEIPDAHLFMTDRLLAFDHLERRAWIIVCPGVRETVLGYSDLCGLNPAHVSEAEEVIERIQKSMDSDDPHKKIKFHNRKTEIFHDTGKARYIQMVKKAKEYIAAGDIFQANLSLRVSSSLGERDPWAIYAKLREINPSPFASFIDFGDYQIASSSPERLVRINRGVADTRPIAGTRPRGGSPGEDELLRHELLLNEKERAEHIMLIDLERNDLGRVCSYGTVGVDELMITESYSHVMHIVSNVKGLLAAGMDCFDVIRAAFPGGTITGVPKVRCMEIIDELESFRRGPYTGSIGYIGYNGNMDLNIVIRTFVIKGGKAYIQAGAGIVADSDPEREYHECLKKAEALIRTLESV